MTKPQTVLQCPHCHKLNTLVKGGYQIRSGQGKVQQYRCKAEGCGRTTTKPKKVNINHLTYKDGKGDD